MTSDCNRRTFVGTALASGVFTIVPRHVLGDARFVAPSNKIRLAHRTGRCDLRWAKHAGLTA